MDEKELKLREAIRKKVRKYLDEISTTGNVAGYLTPHAFAGEKGNKDRVNRVAKSIGYSLTKKGKEDTKADKLKEEFNTLKKELKVLTENYYAYRNDNTKLPHQKIGTAISEMVKQMKMIERVLKMNNRLKKEYGVSNERLWKRTKHQMTKLEGKLVEMAGRLREMRG
jgi:hypothetical protein